MKFYLLYRNSGVDVRPCKVVVSPLLYFIDDTFSPSLCHPSTSHHVIFIHIFKNIQTIHSKPSTQLRRSHLHRLVHFYCLWSDICVRTGQNVLGTRAGTIDIDRGGDQIFSIKIGVRRLFWEKICPRYSINFELKGINKIYRNQAAPQN